MSIKTSKIRVQPLRGMDDRWVAQPNKALVIKDMTWTPQDSWKQSGGFGYAVHGYFAALVSEKELSYTAAVVSYRPTQPDLPADIATRKERDSDLSDEVEKTVRRTAQVVSSTSQETKTDETLKQQRVDSIRKQPLSGKTDVESIDDVYLNYAYERQAEPISLHWFSQFNGGIQWLLYETSDNGLYQFYGSGAPVTPWKVLHYVNAKPIDGTSMERRVSASPWSGTNFCTFAGRVYMVNGHDIPLVFDGKKCTRAGYGQHAMVSSAVVNENETPSLDRSLTKATTFGLGHYAYGTATTIDATFSYKVTFLNERGQESPSGGSSTSVSIENSTTQRRLVTVELPLGPEGTVARRIYRTQNMYDADGVSREQGFGNEFYSVDEVQDNISRYYVDVHPDVNLGSLHTESFYGLWPARADRIAAFKNTMFLANSEESIVTYSGARKPEEFPRDNEIHVGDSISGPVTALYPTKNSLVVFKSRGVYLIKGDPLNGFFPFTLTKDVGCIAPKSLKEIPGVGVCFLAREGVFILQGALENTGTITGVTRIGQPIETVLRRINYGAAENVRSCINFRDREYWLHVPVDGEVYPNMLLKFHYEVGEWSISEDFVVRDVVCTEDHRNYIYLACQTTTSTNKGLMVYRSGDTKKGRVDITPLYQTSHLAVGNFYSSFDVVRMQVMAVGYGDNVLSANFVVNRELTDAYVVSRTSKQKRPLEDKVAPIYGAATLDTTYTFAEHRPVPLRFDVTAMHKGLVGEISFTFSSGTKRMQLVGYQIEVRLGAAREFVNLTELFGGSVFDGSSLTR